MILRATGKRFVVRADEKLTASPRAANDGWSETAMIDG